MKKFYQITLPAALLLAPALAFAQLTRTATLINQVRNLVNTLTIIVSALALLVFFWGLVKFLLKLGGDAKAAQEGKTLMIWGTVALFVMVSIWGLVRFIQRELIPGESLDNPNVPSLGNNFTLQ